MEPMLTIDAPSPSGIKGARVLMPSIEPVRLTANVRSHPAGWVPESVGQRQPFLFESLALVRELPEFGVELRDLLVVGRGLGHPVVQVLLQRRDLVEAALD